MPTNYSGNPANITTPLNRTIVDCTSGAGGLVMVETSASHLFATYDYVTISGVLGTTEANGTNQIEVVDATNFLLVGVPFVTAYSSGGSVDDISLTPYFQIPDDGESGTAQSIEASIQMLADRSQFIWGHLVGSLGSGLLQADQFTADDSWQAPPGVNRVFLMGYGAGGGGGGGAGGSTSATRRSGGGGGGGGALMSTATVSVTPGTSYAITIGVGGSAGGGAGVENDTGGPGGDGSDTYFAGLARFQGAQGGQGGSQAALAGPNQNRLAFGGGATLRSRDSAFTTGAFASRPHAFPDGIASGGLAYVYADNGYSFSGADSPISIGGDYSGGASATDGADDSPYLGGGPGGGGGAGPYGSGGNGGDGGYAANSGSIGGGFYGSAAPVSSGGGGGAGGGGGSGGDGFGFGGNGATGGGGRLIVIYAKVSL